MFFLDITRRSARSLLSSKIRTALTAFAIAVGAFALTLTLAASNGARAYGNSVIQDNFDPSQLVVSKDPSLFSTTNANSPEVYNPSYGTLNTITGAVRQVQELDDTDLTTISHIKGVSYVSPAISLALQYITRDGFRKYVGTLEAYSSYKAPALLAGSIPPTLPAHSLILPQGWLSSFGFSTAQSAIGQTLRVSVQKQSSAASLITAALSGNTAALSSSPSSQETTFTVIAVTQTPSSLIAPGSGLYLYTDNADVAALNDYVTVGTTSYHKYLSAYVEVKDGTNVELLNAAQTRIKAAGYGAESVVDTEQTLNQIINVLQGIVTVFGLIAVVASVFGVVNTMYISVLQRIREIGLMKALGMHKKDINRLFQLEAGFIGLLGGVIGTGLAVALGTALNPIISKKLSLGSTHLLEFRWPQLLILLVALMLVAMLAGVLPARKAAKLDPIEALRTE